jgi:hypothetical protein
MINIVIIGCGQIGSRHLQALSKINEGATIYLVDTSTQSIQTSRERFEEVINYNESSKFEIKVCDIDQIDIDIDIAIIATSSLNRASLTEKLLSCVTVKNIIFEKFLFQNRFEYTNIKNLLKEQKVKAWVNQWMSSSIAFVEMAKWFGKDLQEIKVEGKNWGLACNSVHFVEYLDSISNRQKLTVRESNLDNKVIKSKRPGYFELTGSVTIQSESGILLNLACVHDKNAGNEKQIYIRMKSKKRHLEASLSNGVLKCDYYDDFYGSSFKEYVLPMQSQATGSIVETILSKNSCILPTYEHSMRQHLVLFDCFEGVFSKQLKLNGTCPIT